jgi:glutathione S-transferase
MSTPALTLYFAPGSSSMAPHIALHEIGVPFESRAIAFSKKEHKTPAFLAINHEGKVPVLLIDGRPLTEVAAILFYLAKRFPEAALLPDGDEETEAHVVSWMSFVAATLHPWRQAGDEYALRVFGQAETRLGSNDWAVERYSIADIHLFRLFWRFWHSFHPDREDFPNLCAHYDRVMARPAVQRTCAIEAEIGYELTRFRPRDA